MVADGTLENAPYTGSTRWVMQGDLFKLLTLEPELLVGNNVLQDFYTEVAGEVVAQLKDLDMEQLGLFQLDASVIDALAQGASQLEALQAQMAMAVAELGEPVLTSAQRQAQAQAVLGLQGSIAALLNYHANALELAAEGRALTADAIKATNAAVAAGALIEQNHKTVNEIYLSTIAKSIDSFTATEAEALFAVANQCPLTGGNAVFRARSLYALIDDEQDFDDPTLCLQEGLITKRLRTTETAACTVIPNPARDQATLLLSTPLTEPGWLLLYNTMGEEVLRVIVPREQASTAFGTQRLAAGIYHYTLLDARGVVENGKLAIEH